MFSLLLGVIMQCLLQDADSRQFYIHWCLQSVDSTTLQVLYSCSHLAWHWWYKKKNGDPLIYVVLFTTVLI